MPKILIADDSEAIRRALKNALSNHPGWTVCGEASSGRQAVLMASNLNPDLIILDLAMPELDGLHAAIEILKCSPSVPIVLFTMYESDQIEIEARKAGIRKVISKGKGITPVLKTFEELLGRSVSSALELPTVGPIGLKVELKADPAVASAQDPDTGPKPTDDQS